MITQKTKLVRREEAAKGTCGFYFEKPAGFTFKAGQYITMTLVDPPETDAEGNTRDFSIASAPHEEHLLFTTRMRDTAFKRVLKTAALGTEVAVTKAFGSLILHNDSSRPAVFLAGGIGITPFRSMVLDAAHRALPHRIFLFYSNRRPKDAAFLEELCAVKEKNKNFTLIATMTKRPRADVAAGIRVPPPRRFSEPPSLRAKGKDNFGSGTPRAEIAVDVLGPRGRITAEMIKKNVPDILKPIYYIAGPPLMVEAMRQMLDKAGVNSDNVRSEDFAGY